MTQTTVDYWRPATAFLSYKREDAEQVKLPDPIVDKEQFNKELRLVAGRILRAAYTLRLQRVGADRAYEPCINFHTFDYEPPATSLDLDLDWTEFFEGKDEVPTGDEWEEILMPWQWLDKSEGNYAICATTRAFRISTYLPRYRWSLLQWWVINSMPYVQ